MLLNHKDSDFIATWSIFREIAYNGYFWQFNLVLLHTLWSQFHGEKFRSLISKSNNWWNWNPSRSATICTYGKAKLGVGTIVAFSILYNIPRFFEVSWVKSNNATLLEDGGLDQVISVEPTWLRMDSTYISVYITWMYLVFMYVLPFGGLSILNMLMFLDVR